MDTGAHDPGESPTPLGAAVAKSVALPAYLQEHYWWAYLHPRAVQTFERKWLVNLILLGHYATLREAALAATLKGPAASVLQVACVYGDLTPSLLSRLGPGARLSVVDVAAVQLRNLAGKLPPDPRVALLLGDSTALGYADASQDRVLMFFLLHEQPEAVRRATLAEGLRVLRPSGRMVLVDYHGPRRWHPLRAVLRAVLGRLEPFALDMWRHPISHFLPPDVAVEVVQQRTWFGGLYQLLVLQRREGPV